MAWQVYGYVKHPTNTYDGKGDRSIYRDFDNQPDAERYAKHIVESGPAYYATVERVEKISPIAPLRAAR